MKLLLKTLRLVGVRKNYEIHFHKGLNYISGPTSTGKTAILELIDYALGKAKHKAYIEIGESCTDVELEFYILENLYKIKRPLSAFSEPVLLQAYDNTKKQFSQNRILTIDNPSKENSLSYFLLSKLNLNNLTVMGDSFSFRDLFKFSYLKQTKIDSENILDSQNWAGNRKEKATFEIILDIYDNLLSDLQKSLKIEQEVLKEKNIRYDAVHGFLEKAEIENYETVQKKSFEIDSEIDSINSKLENYKLDIISAELGNDINDLVLHIDGQKEELRELRNKFLEQEQYIQKLQLLENQYFADIEKISEQLAGIKAINKYEYIYCPNCLQPLSLHDESNCLLCNQNMNSVIIEVGELRKERTKLTKKKNELHKYIELEVEKRARSESEISNLQDNIDLNEEKLDGLTRQYISPLSTAISSLSIKVGELYESKKNLKESLKFIEELTTLEKLLSEKRIEVEGIKDKIEKQKNKVAKDNKLRKLTQIFSIILSSFDFPNLHLAYIEDRSYLPYVRGVKYSDLGSLGAVTLITMAYYLSVMICSEEQAGNHIGLLMIDTPRKNLGSSSKSAEFRDERIYESIIKYFIKLGQERENDFQLIVVNNGYPSILPQDCIVKEFSSDGLDGLIDDYGV
ncbi:AAA family ATPase [Streptococcus gallinaceus]|uniref:DNA repair exonuclease SbcCD ATPase subunit n=1 Tax=Streptococcus gallinaceus TaxID=165758 RepID=A0ABV2JLT4_9STRE